MDGTVRKISIMNDPDISDEHKPCPHCNDEGVVCTLDGEIIGPCDCTSDDLFTEARRLLDAATPGPWERPSPTANWFTVPQPIQIDEADWGQETQEGGAMCGYRIGTLADERAWRYADVELIAAAPRLIAALLERAVTAEAEAEQKAEHHDWMVDALEAERDAERAGRERAEAENGRLRALTEGDPYSIYYEAAEMRSELMHLRRWKLEATEVIESWELVYEALGDVGGLGQRRSDAVLAEVLRMKAELDRAQLRSIEASNPGIDMDEVRRVRLAYPDPERHETVSRAKYGASLASDIAADGGAAVAEVAEDAEDTE